MSEDSTEKTQRVVVNRKFGGFRLSTKAEELLKERHDIEVDYDNRYDPEFRNSDELASVVEELGDEANGAHAKLEVAELPADVEWAITEYDGVETIREKHRTWPGGEFESGMVSSYDE